MLLRTVTHERRSRRAAFTLMEILIVVAIIVIIASLGSYYVIGQYNEARVSQAKIKARSISNAVDTYYVDNGEYPANLEALLQKNPNTGKGPYHTNQDAIFDPWGKEFQLDVSGQRNLQAGATVPIPDVFTTTPDGRTIGNWSDNKK